MRALRPRADDGPRPFASAEAAWLWCAAQLAARRDGRAPRHDMREGGHRPCTPDDILRVLERIHQEGRMTLDQARVLARYGDKQRSPSPAMLGEEQDFHRWRRAMRELQAELEAKGVVRARPPREAAWGAR